MHVHMKLIVLCFRCAPEVNQIECALDAHQSCSHGTTGTCKQIRRWSWVSCIAAKGYKVLEKSIPAYWDHAGRVIWGLSCSCSTVGCSICQNKVAQQNHWDYLNAEPLFSAIRKQSSFFPNVAARAEQKIAIQHVHKPSQWGSQRSHERCNIVWILNSSLWIFFLSTSQNELDTMHIRCTLDFKWINVDATNRIGCVFDVHCGVHVNRPLNQKSKTIGFEIL